LKKFILLLSLLPLSCLAAEESQTKNYSIGVGIGAMYSGIGANFSFVSENDLKFISAGCTAYGSTNGAECGVGIGWIKTDLFGADSNKHGFGIYGGSLGKEHRSPYPSVFEEYDIYGAGVSYTYFMNGINKSGTTFGVSIHATNAQFEDNIGGFFQVGYQF